MKGEGGGNERKGEKSWESLGFGRAPGGVDGGAGLGRNEFGPQRIF